jgi:hypothetical protein
VVEPPVEHPVSVPSTNNKLAITHFIFLILAPPIIDSLLLID